MLRLVYGPTEDMTADILTKPFHAGTGGLVPGRLSSLVPLSQRNKMLSYYTLKGK